MGKNKGENRDWQRRGQFESARQGAESRTKRVQTLLSARRNPQEHEKLVRRGVTTPTVQHYSISADPTNWKSPGQAAIVPHNMLASVEDGQDRLVLAWPYSPINGFAAAAMALREARSSGRLAHATFGFWPWRAGATFGARSLLLQPSDVHQAAARIATELRTAPTWASPRLAHESQCLLDLRLGDLKPPTSLAALPRSILVRSPTVLETTSVFPPVGTGAPYRADPEQVLRRVRDYTHMGDKNAGLTDHVAAVGDPERAPFAIFGLPAESRVDRLARFLAVDRFAATGLDVVIVDATRNGRIELSDHWDARLAVLLQALEALPGRRPPVVVLVEDVFSMRKASKVFRAHNASQVPRRARAIETGAYLPDPSPFADAADLSAAHPEVAFEADIKDASLAPLREDLVALGRRLREAGHAKAAEGVSQALALLRRSASLPIGLDEARAASDVLYDGTDEVDASARTLFRPKMALAPLAAVAETAPEFGDVAKRLVVAVEAKLATWRDETPVSMKLAAVLQDTAWNNRRTLITIGDRRVMESFLGSDRAVTCDCAVVDHRALREEINGGSYERLIVLGPTPDSVRTLLSAVDCPDRVMLLGDAAGSALVVAEAAPIGQLVAFAPVAGRAKALAAALASGGANERLDLAEAEFRIAATLPEGEIDFTQAGERYRGDIIQVRTQRGHRLAYRPASDILLLSPSEVRPFEKAPARDLKKGDRLLVLNAEVREPIRRALAGSRQALSQLKLYHDHINRILAETPGGTLTDQARHVLASMKTVDPTTSAAELPNVVRWLTAGRAAEAPDGVKQPRAARDWRRFKIFMEAVGVAATLADMYWKMAVVPARSYRAQEGHFFNQRVVQFVLDPEGAAIGASAWTAMPRLWRSVLESVDEVTAVEMIKGERNG